VIDQGVSGDIWGTVLDCNEPLTMESTDALKGGGDECLKHYDDGVAGHDATGQACIIMRGRACR
jgi:hypothetical protein